jgi:hypothetical protein
MKTSKEMENELSSIENSRHEHFSWRGLLYSLVLSSALSLAAWGQTYSIDWYKVSGGGGTWTGGAYSVSGTIGQHDAGGPLKADDYCIMGGFWSLISVVQTSELPNLAISLSGSSVIVSWPNTAVCTLQQSSDLAVGNWVTCGYTVTTLNGTNSITIASPAGELFFRLKQ